MSQESLKAGTSTGIWHSLNRFVFTLILLSAAVPIAYSFLPEVKKHKEQQRQIEDLKSQIEKQRMYLARYQREAKLLILDPEYVEMIARDRLDLMKEGETIYRIDPPKPAPKQMRRNP